jgi:hypothetical protein
MTTAAMIIGPGEAHRWLDRTLRHISGWADQLVCWLDGADPDTTSAVIHGPVPCRVDGSADCRFTTDESLVRNSLCALLDAHAEEGELIVVIDADEQLTATSSPTSAALRALRADHTYHCWPVTFLHLWTPDGSAYRVDGAWAPHAQNRIYRHKTGGRVGRRTLACPAVPSWISQCAPDSALRMLHYGYARHDDRVAKHQRYMTLDAGAFHARWHLESIITEPQLQAVTGALACT